MLSITMPRLAALPSAAVILLVCDWQSVPAAAGGFTLSQTFNDPTPTNVDSFGNSVDIDGQDVLIAAFLDDTVAENAGQVHLFDGIGGTNSRTFLDPMARAQNWFGDSVAIDAGLAVVGVPQASTSGASVGAVHLFDTTSGSLQRTFLDPTVTGSERFGRSVAIDAGWVVVGSPNDDTNGFNVGQAYLFNAFTGGLVQTFDDPTPTDSDGFGYAVSIDGDHVLIGARFHSINGSRVGQAHLFDRVTGNLLHTFDDPTVSTNPGTSSSDLFGTAVDVNGRFALVGAPGDATNGSFVGQAYLFDTETGNLLHTFDDPTPSGGGDSFGDSVSIDGLYAVVGANGDSTSGPNVGQAHVFNVDTGTLLQTLEDPTETAVDRFGASVAIDENRVVVGARGDGTNGVAVGQAHLFTLPASGITVGYSDPNDPFGVPGTDVVWDALGTKQPLESPIFDPLYASALAIGDTGDGELVAESGATINVVDRLLIGVENSADGLLRIEGASTHVDVGGATDIGVQGLGRLTLLDGATMRGGGDVRVGAGSIGEATVAVVGATLTAEAGLSVGDEGFGTLTIEGGATVSSVDGYVGAGTGENRDGTVFVGGMGSTWSNSGTLVIDRGSLSIFDGGRAEVGGDLELRDVSALVFVDGGVLVVGGVLDTAGTVLLLGGTVSADSGVTLADHSSLTGDGVVESPNDPAKALRNDGLLAGVSAAAPLTLTGFVRGVGLMDNVVITGTDAPGLSTAAVTRGNVAYEGVLQIEIGGVDAGVGYDQVNHELGPAVADLGGTLELDLIDGFEPSAGDAFVVLTTSGQLLGEFDSFTPEALANPALDWTLVYTTDSVVVAALPTLSGDYNGDGLVDAADYTVWRDSFGETGPALAADGDRSGEVDQGDYGLWRSQYGASPPAGSGVIPETGSLCLALIASATQSFARRKR